MSIYYCVYITEHILMYFCSGLANGALLRTQKWRLPSTNLIVDMFVITELMGWSIWIIVGDILLNTCWCITEDILPNTCRPVTKYIVLSIYYWAYITKYTVMLVTELLWITEILNNKIVAGLLNQRIIELAMLIRDY
jgi:hypothetical protein